MSLFCVALFRYTGKALSRQAAIEITCHDHSTTAWTLGDFIVLKLLWYLVAAFGALTILSPRLRCASSTILLRRQPCNGTCTITSLPPSTIYISPSWPKVLNATYCCVACSQDVMMRTSRARLIAPTQEANVSHQELIATQHPTLGANFA